MSARHKGKSILARKLENPEFRKRFEEGYAAFELEVQILNAMEKKGWSFSDLAKALHAHKSNISRDLSLGGINSATVSRLTKIGEVLGLQFLPLFIPKQLRRSLLPKIQKLVTA